MTRYATPVDKRPGTIMSDNSITFLDKNRKVVGLYDESTRVFQFGSPLTSVIYRAKQLLSIPEYIWDRIHEKLERIEFINHDDNKCLYLTKKDAERFGERYTVSIGRRYGFPISKFKEMR